MSLIIKIEGPVGFGPYRKRTAFLERLWDQSDQMMDEWIAQGKVPASQPGFNEWRMRLRRARHMNWHLKKRYPDPVRELLENIGEVFMKP